MRVGRWAVIVAAYALLLNVTLTASLFASLSPSSFDPLHTLCLRSDLSGNGTADHDSPHKRAISCPLCLVHNAFSVMAPSPPTLQTPSPTAKIAELPPSETRRTIGGLRSGWARGPPSLV